MNRNGWLVFISVSIMCATALSAQTVLPTMSQPNPGARSLGLGGAFVAQADDATAAYSNSAGLVALVRPEISGELRFSVKIDPFRDELEQQGNEDIFTLGFLSAAYPIGRWSLAIYRNQFSTLDTTIEELDTSATTTDLTTYGLSCGYRFSERFSLGLGVAYNQGRLPETETRSLSNTSAAGWGFTTGILWRLNEHWQVGGSFRSGPKVDFGASSEPFKVGFPDVAAIGFSYRTLGGALTISTEWDHIWYSEAHGFVANPDDDDEQHLGIEYAILTTTPIMALRFGTWHDPVGFYDSRTHEFTSEMHYSTGFGIAFSRFQMDFALDFSDPLVTISASGIFFF